MRTCLNLVTLQRGVDPLQGAKVAAQTGFEGIGIWAESLEHQPDPLGYAHSLAAACRQQGLRIEELCFVGGWMWAPAEQRVEALEVIRRRAELAAAANCPLIIACASAGTGDVRQAAEDFRTICDIGSQFGVSFALEYIGAFEQLKDLRTGLEIARLANHPHGKLLIDTFHTFRGGSLLEDFDLPCGHEVGLVHINDVPPGDITAMTDADRLMPGDGVLPLREALAKLAHGGYQGAVSVEVFSEYWWGRPFEETAAKALSALRQVLP